MLRRVFKAAGWTVLGLAALCVVLYLIAVAINWRDQEPSATAVRFANLYRDRPVVADDDNAYVYLMGFGVSPDESPHELGLKRIAWMHGADGGVRLDLADDPLGERPDYRSERPPAISSYLKACGTGGSGCAAAFDAATDGFEQWVATEKWLPERYLALIDHAGWREEVPSSLVGPPPSYGLVMEGQKLLLLDAKVRARKGDHAGVRDLLARDLRFWRRVFESSDTVLTKMIAKGAIDRHFSLGNLVLRSLPSDRAVDALPEEWRTPISDSERSLLRFLVGEWTYMSAVLRNFADSYAAANDDSVLASAQNRLAEPFFQPQATINAHAEHYSRLAALLNVPLDRYEAAVGRTAELAQQTFPSRSVYNVVGQILTGMGSASYEDYARRIGDVEGMRRAALAVVTMRAASVAPHDMPAALATSPLRNPYTGRPFEWDGEAVVFRGLEPGTRGEHRHYY